MLLRAGYAEREGLLLATRDGVDLHLACDLVARGCPTRTAVKILVQAMSNATMLVTFSVGAVLLALWLDVRRPAPSLRRAMGHAAASFVVLQLLPPTLKTLDVESSTSIRLAALLFLVVLPALVYGFFALTRLLRALAAMRALRRCVPTRWKPESPTPLFSPISRPT